MIPISRLKKSNIGKEVKYVCYPGSSKKEIGHITSWNDKYIFVNYGTTDGYGVATRPEDLYFNFFYTRFDILDI